MAELTLDSCPLLAAGVSFHAADVASGPWIVAASDVPVSRVSPAVVDLLRALDGRTPARDLRRSHADTLSDDDFLSLLTQFEGSGLLAGAERRAPGRVVYRPPLTLQLATLRAPRVFARLDRLRRAVLRRWMLLPAALVVLLGLIALVVEAPTAVAVLTEPLPLTGFLVVVGVLVVATLVHEAAHGMTLAGHGALPRRAGVMLFYLSPAFFVDVTNGWRLADRKARVAVALAGPAVHATLGSAAALAAPFAWDAAARDTLLILAVASWSVVLVNLVPFVRFDGYLALMSALDIPNLRASAILDVRDAAAHALYGAPRRPRRLPQRWIPAFGVLSILTPVILILFGLDRIIRALAPGGVGGALATLVVVAATAAVACATLVRGARRLLSGGASGVRMAGVGALIAVVVGLLGFAIPVPTTLTLGFVADGGSVRLVTAGDAVSTLAPGSAVTLSTNGILGRRVLASATLLDTPDDPASAASRIEVPLSAVFPLEAPGVVVPGLVVGVVDADRLDVAALPSAGAAIVHTGDTNVWSALWQSTVIAPMAVLGLDVSAAAPRAAGSSQ